MELLEKCKDYSKEGLKIKIKGKKQKFPIIKTSDKSAYYLDEEGNQRYVTFKKIQYVIRPTKLKNNQTTNWGGHMPNVPISCKNPKKFTDDRSNITWIDINVCNVCKKNKGCSRFQEFYKSINKGRKR